MEREPSAGHGSSGRHRYGPVAVETREFRRPVPAVAFDCVKLLLIRDGATVLVTEDGPTRGMIQEANHSGSWAHPSNGQTYPRVQIISVPELFAGKKPNLPPVFLPYVAAQRAAAPTGASTLFDFE